MVRTPFSGLTTEQHTAAKEEMRSILIEHARARQTVCYSELCRMMQTVYIHHRAPGLHHLLGEICAEEVARGHGKLCALVVSKATGIPGGGYFGGLASPDRDASDLEALWRADRDEVFEYWRQQ